MNSLQLCRIVFPIQPSILSSISFIFSAWTPPFQDILKLTSLCKNSSIKRVANSVRSRKTRVQFSDDHVKRFSILLEEEMLRNDKSLSSSSEKNIIKLNGLYSNFFKITMKQNGDKNN